MGSNGEIKVEKGVPLPNGGARSKYPYAQMEVGDSFVASIRQRNGTTALAKRFGIKVTVHKIDDDHVRVWRIA